MYKLDCTNLYVSLTPSVTLPPPRCFFRSLIEEEVVKRKAAEADVERERSARPGLATHSAGRQGSTGRASKVTLEGKSGTR